MDFREQLAAVFPEQNHKLIFHAKGAQHPSYNDLNHADSLAKFCSELLPQCPLIDPRPPSSEAPGGKKIKVIKTNFPKLVDLEHKTLCKDDFNATCICACIEDGTFDLAHYQPPDKDRIRTLFWLPEVIQAPDAIYKNGHKIVAGDEIYVRVYNKDGAKVKVAFTMDYKKGGKITQTVIITSFLTSPERALSFVKGQPLYVRK